ncbi:MAG: GNAT family N-acetyltransferase [Candidatus Dormibacteraeota bacterium]|nr:GNAT family N-acetyltransferase [Candidatus Dormibacteraeota bacterium]
MVPALARPRRGRGQEDGERLNTRLSGFSVAPEVLVTERLELEPIGPQHADALFEATVASRTELLPWMPWARDPTPAGSRGATESGERDWDGGSRFHFALVSRASRQVLGVAGLDRGEPWTAELHYWIRTDHAGRGLTTEAGRALVAWAPRALGVRRLTLWAGRDNGASRRVAAKLGFSHLGALDWRPGGGLGDFDAERYELHV